MSYIPELSEEVNILLQFNLDTLQTGIKVHHTAAEEAVRAARRLYQKGLVTQEDGGYLTALGREAAEHAQTLLGILTVMPPDAA